MKPFAERNGILSEMTIDEVRALRPEVVILGVGSTEPHGPALPYGTDYWQVDALCRKAVLAANPRGARALQYPTLPVGNNVNFKAWPFACRVSVRTLMLMLLDIIAALEADGIRKIVLVDGHGGNSSTMLATLREHMDITPAERRAFVCISHGRAAPEALQLIKHPSDHGGESEVSRMMYLRPELVHDNELQDQPVGRPMIEALSAVDVQYVKPWHRHLPMSGGGNTCESSAEKGRQIIETGADNLARLLLELAQTPWHPEFPYPAQDCS